MLSGESALFAPATFNSGFRFGSGLLWTAAPAPSTVHYDPSAHGTAVPSFSLMYQLDGAIVAAQGGRSSALAAGDICVLDGLHPFELTVRPERAQVAFLRMPRDAVLSRHAYLEDHTAEAFDASDPGVKLLRQALQVSIDLAPQLGEEQRAAALLCITQLLGAPRMPPTTMHQDAGWRVRAALALVEAELPSAHLNAAYVAAQQGISRRRLDQILIAAIGVSISRHICMRRLEHAAESLRNPQYADRPISQVAFAAGFEDAAHFSRAFKQRFSCTPLEWRRQRRDPAEPLRACG